MVIVQGDLIVVLIFWFALVLANVRLIVFVAPLPIAPHATPTATPTADA